MLVTTQEDDILPYIISICFLKEKMFSPSGEITHLSETNTVDIRMLI